MDRYLDLKGIDSKINEKNNSCLKCIKPTLSDMTQKILCDMLPCLSGIATK